MRIIHLLNHCNHGHGNAHVAIDLACVQADNGHEVIYASAGGDFEWLLSAHNVKLIRVDQDYRGLLSLFRGLYALINLCRSFKPDVIHAHMMGAAVFGFIASRLTGTPLVTTVHNSFDFHSFLMRLGDRVVAVSEAERRRLQDRGFPPQRLRTVLNGPNESPRDRHISSAETVVARPCITTVCGLHKRKGVPDLLRAFATVLSEFPEWRLNIVGQGPDAEALKALASELGAAGSVTFLGHLASSRPVLESTDIFVLASYADPCSLAVCEARYAGCAIVATSVGGTPEILDQGQAGKLVEPGRPDQIALALRPLMSDQRERSRWRERAKVGSEHLTVSRLARDYDDVYRSAREGSRWSRLA